MKRFFTLLLFGLSLAVLPVMAQDDEEIDESYVFVDGNGAVIPNGSTVVRDQIVTDGEGNEMIASGIFVKNVSAPSTLFLRMHYEITQLPNGYFQLCFPITCNSQSEEGYYTTSEGLVNGTQDIQSEWFPEADGVCEVVLSIETMTQKSAFPPRYIHSGNGPTITVRFVKGAQPQPPMPGDVNEDGDVNITDVIDFINYLLNDEGDINLDAADYNEDSDVNITDVIDLIGYLLNTV